VNQKPASTKNSWRVAAEQRRSALRMLGLEMPDCLEGEIDDCGSSDIEHFMAYTATLMAQAQWDMFAVAHACPGQGADVYLADFFAHQVCLRQPDALEHLDLPLESQHAMLEKAVDEHLGC
jgi:hypothetical protein